MCVIQCLETVVEYITESAFCFIAVTGDNFFTGAYNGFILHIKHMSEFWWTATFAKFFMFLAKVSVIVGNMAVFYFLLTPLMVGKKTSKELYGPLIVVGLISYIMVSIFVGMYDVSSEAMLTCYAIDVDANNGTNKFGPETFWDGKMTDKIRANENKLKERRSKKVTNEMV